MSELLSQRITLNSVVPILSLHVSRYTPQPPHPSTGGKNQRGWQGKRRDRRKRILRNRNVHGVSSSPASRRDGCVPPVHSVRIRSSPILSRTSQVDGMGRTVALQAAFMEDIAVGFFHGGGGCGHIAVDHFILRTSGGTGLREASSRSYNAQTRRCRCRR